MIGERDVETAAGARKAQEQYLALIAEYESEKAILYGGVRGGV